MAERVDVCIVGSGFGGSVAAWRLAELYRTGTGAPRDPALALEWATRAREQRVPGADEVLRKLAATLRQEQAEYEKKFFKK